MFASMFKTIFNKFDKKVKMGKKDSNPEAINIARQQVDQLLTEMDDNDENISSSCDNQLMFNENITDGFELMSVNDIFEENSEDLVNSSDENKSVVSFVGENKRAEVDDPSKKKLINQINSLQCLFTWNIKPKHKKNVILSIQNSYGEYNLDISSAEFTFERFIGNLVIGYEIFLKGDSETAQMKILEIGKWLEELDSGTDEFYLSINIGLKHVMTATFIHMLFATNLTEECKWLLNDISSFANMDPKSRATVFAIRAAVLTEYGINLVYLKKACECGKKACELDPNTPHWFYILSLALTAQRRFINTRKSCPTEFEINAIQQAILLSDGKNTYYNYQRMTLDKETIIDKFHRSTNKYDKSVIDKNYEENKIIVQMIKTIMSMEPKDPHLVVKCARTLITLPRMVRDFKLGKQYLQSAVEMAPNDSTVLTAVTNAIHVYNEIKRKPGQKTNTVHNKPSFKNNKPLRFRDELRIAVKKHKNGENPIPYLVDLIAKYTGHNNKWTIMAQICSYTILFLNNLRSGIEQFIMLIEQQPGIINNTIITHHYSSFGSKKFNLAELLCNEIRLATNSSKTPSEDMLFYYKTLTQIMETFNLNIKDIDPSMKDKLVVDSCARSVYSNTTSANENNFSGDESVNSEVKQRNKNKNQKPRHLQNTGPKIHIKKPELNKAESKRNENFKNTTPKNSNASKNIQNKTHQANASSDSNQLKFKMAKFLNSSANSSINSNDANHLVTENLRNLKTQAEIEHYTKQLYQSILTNTQQQYNLQGNNSQNFNEVLNQNHANFNPLFQQFQNQTPSSLLNLKPQINQQPPPLLSLKPQINHQKPRPVAKQPPMKDFPKKK